MIVKRIASGILGVLALLAGAFACLFAISATSGYLRSELTVWSAIIPWCITLMTLAFAMRFLQFAVFQTQNCACAVFDSLLLGVGCFFPGFVVTALVAGRLVEKPSALRASLLVGMLCAVIGSVVYLDRRREQL